MRFLRTHHCTFISFFIEKLIVSDEVLNELIFFTCIEKNCIDCCLTIHSVKRIDFFNCVYIHIIYCLKIHIVRFSNEFEKKYCKVGVSIEPVGFCKTKRLHPLARHYYRFSPRSSSMYKNCFFRLA